MSRTDAQIAASRANGLKSRGPRTAAGKTVSRCNALKHGMAGEGVVLPVSATAEVDRRTAAMIREIQPSCEIAAYHVRRLARLTVRVEVCADNELAAIEYRANHAEEAFDEARIAEVDETLAGIGKEPSTFARKLHSMPEGVDRIIAELLKLLEELNTGRWDWMHGEKVSHLMGDRWMEIPVTRVRALSEAIVGNFEFLRPGEGECEGLSKEDRINWARSAMGALIDDEVEMLLAHRETLDLGAIERDRAGAVGRSAFDPSKEAILARRYEAAADRAVFKTMNELRRVEAEAAASRLAEEDRPVEPSGSFGAEAPETQEEQVGPVVPPRRSVPDAAPKPPTSDHAVVGPSRGGTESAETAARGSDPLVAR